MKLYLIRHGQSEANLNKYFAGQSQVKLTEEGIKQAQFLNSIIGHMIFDKIFSSDLCRAIDTHANALPGTQCEITPLLREIDVGSLSGTPLSECLERYGEDLRTNISKADYVRFGGENSLMLMERIKKFLDQITSLNYTSVALFTHGGLITATIEYLLNIETDKYFFEASNCSVNILDYSNGKWKLDLYNYTGKNFL